MRQKRTAKLRLKRRVNWVREETTALFEQESKV